MWSEAKVGPLIHEIRPIPPICQRQLASSSVTVSVRASNVASFNSLSDFDHQDGTKSQRIRSAVHEFLPGPNRRSP